MKIQEIKRKKGTVYRVRGMRDGQRYDETFTRKYDATKARDKIMEDGASPATTKLTFKEASAHWINNHAKVHKAPSSISGDQRMLAKHILPVLGKLKLRKIKACHIEDLIGTLKAKGLSINSIQRNLDPISAIMNYYLRNNELGWNPMTAVGRLKPDEQRIQFWVRQEANQFLTYTKQKYQRTDRYGIHLLYKVALHTGMRLGELLALKWSEVDFENHLITVCRSHCSVSKGIRETTKSHKIRHVPLGVAIRDDLLDARRQRSCDFVFSLNGNIIDRSNLRNRYFNKDIRESGVKKIRIHDLRHTYASSYMMGGGNIFELQSILGHSDMRMTQRYSHFTRGHIAERGSIVCFDDGKVIGVDFRKKEAIGA